MINQLYIRRSGPYNFLYALLAHSHAMAQSNRENYVCVYLHVCVCGQGQVKKEAQ